jgi:peptide/nickel transport system permease protein
MRHGVLLAAIGLRFLKTLGLLLGILAFVFVIIRVLPGDIVDVMAIDSGLDEAMKAELRAELGLDRDIFNQFLEWIGRMASLDFGNSLRFGKPVAELIAYSLPVTLQLALSSCALGLSWGAVLAFLAIRKGGKILPTMVEALNVWSTAVPTFCIGFILIFVFVLGLRIMPLSGNMVLPILILGADIAGQVAKPLYAEMHDTMAERHVLIARAKGLREGAVVWRHVLPNSLTVFIALSGLIVAGTLGGSMTMEVLFDLPGMGKLAYNAVAGRDYPIVQAIAVFIAAVVAVVNLLTDLFAMAIDPRQRDPGRL